MRIIGAFLQNNWEKKVAFRNRIIGRKIRIMCGPLPETRGRVACVVVPGGGPINRNIPIRV